MLLRRRYGEPCLPEWAMAVDLRVNYDILDVGSGVGRHLLKLKDAGFSKLTGIDPHIEDDIFYDSKFRIFKKELSDVNRQFDFIMLHHSFEHMFEPLSTLNRLYQILRPNRFVLIRIPLVSSSAWEKYKTNWVELDAPRHLFLHSTTSMHILSDQAGFTITDITYDSAAFEFFGSELYMRDISLRDARCPNKYPAGSIFSDKEMRLFAEKAEELNRNKKASRACFLLYKG